ncbi:hypothetical protein I4U23_003645 [Adineta vaga]|nr:hypothetical protein I4U23_003645 [Adineta vaga]
MNNGSNNILPSNSLGIQSETLRIHPISDIFEPTKNYVGLIDYLTGEIHIKQSDWVINNIPRRTGRRTGSYLHGRLFYFVYKSWRMRNTLFVGGGFSYLDGTWRYLSRTLNTMNDNRLLNKFEEKLLQVVIDNVYINHLWLKMHSNYRFDCRTLAALERNQQYTSLVHPSDVHINRKLHGTIEWLNDQRRRLGFIKCIGLDRNMYINSTNISNCHSVSCSGTNVEFNIVEEDNTWRADNVTVIWP